jgi:serine phosphatase RsbU (regulator of sigma subunit)
LRIIISHIVLLFLSLNSLAQTFDVTNYNAADYLGRSNIYDFTQDEQLNFYFGTDYGILKFDGYQFSEFNIQGIKGDLKIKRIQYVQDQLFIATKDKLFLYSFKNDSLSTYYDQPINSIQISGESIYILTKNKLLQTSISELSKLNTLYENTSVIFNTAFITDSTKIIGSSDGLFINKQANVYEQTGSFVDVQAIYENYDSSLLVLGKHKVFKYTGDNVSQQLSFDNLTFKDFIVSDLGDLWLTTDNKLLITYNGTKSTYLTEDNGIRNFQINRLKVDKESNLWLLGKNGLSKININQPINQLPFKINGSAFHHENSVLLVKDDQLSIFTQNKEFTNISAKMLGENPISAAFVNSRWIVLSNNKLYTINNNQLQLQLKNLPLNSLYTFKNSLYAIDSGSRFIQVSLENFEIEKKYPTNSIAKVLVNAKNIELIEKDGSVHTIDSIGNFNQKVITLPKYIISKNVASSANGYLSYEKDSLEVINPDGKIWKVSLSRLPKQSGLEIFNVFEDSNEYIWVSTNKFVARISLKKSQEDFEIVEFITFNARDNFSSTYFSKVLELANENLLFIHENNITLYNPYLDIPTLTPPGVKIISATGYNFDRFNNISDTVNLLRNSKLNYSNLISIKAFALTHTKAHKSSIQYRIPTINSNWQTSRFNEPILINDLPVGNNIIELKGVNANGVESDQKTTINIVVSAPFWQKYWFYGTSLGVLLLIGFIGYRSVNNFKDNKTKELHDKLDKELDDLERRSHLQILKAERLKQLNDLITSQKGELEKKNKQIESQKYELSLTNEQIKKQKDLLEETSSKLKASINYAQRIQNALMSTEVEIKNAIDKSFVYFQPRDVVSGDFFWFNTVKNDKDEELLVLAAVDCTGHGVPGAIVSVVGMNLLNNITNLKNIHEPGDILFELNKDIIDNLRQNETQVNDGMDMTLVTINKVTKEIRFAGAKNPLMYIENGELIRIRGDKYAIGGQQRGTDRSYTTHSLAHTGVERMFYIFSDGYQDQFGGEKGFKFLTSNFKELLLKVHDKPVLDQKTIIHETIEDWKGDYAQTDDILVIGFRF